MLGKAANFFEDVIDYLLYVLGIPSETTQDGKKADKTSFAFGTVLIAFNVLEAKIVRDTEELLLIITSLAGWHKNCMLIGTHDFRLKDSPRRDCSHGMGMGWSHPSTPSHLTS